MSNDAEFERAPCVRFRRVIAAPLAEIWALLTEAVLLPQWYGEDGFIGEGEGGKVRFMKGHIRGTITQYRVNARLAYSWNVYDDADAMSVYPESYLTFDLIERDEGVDLQFTHGPVLERFEKQNAMGWHTFLDMLEAAATGQEVKPRTEYLQANAVRYGVDLANLVK